MRTSSSYQLSEEIIMPEEYDSTYTECAGTAGPDPDLHSGENSEMDAESDDDMHTYAFGAQQTIEAASGLEPDSSPPTHSESEGKRAAEVHDEEKVPEVLVQDVCEMHDQEFPKGPDDQSTAMNVEDEIAEHLEPETGNSPAMDAEVVQGDVQEDEEIGVIDAETIENPEMLPAAEFTREGEMTPEQNVASSLDEDTDGDGRGPASCQVTEDFISDIEASMDTAEELGSQANMCGKDCERESTEKSQEDIK